MDYKVLDKVKGSHRIFRSQDYVVLLGKKLWMFQKDGTLIACREDIVKAHKVAFLPGKRLLVEEGKNASYRLLSLANGTDIWRLPPFRKKWIISNSFAISPDNTLAFDYLERKNGNFLIQIDIKTGRIEACELQKGLREMVDMICDEEGIPCILERQYENIGGQQVSWNGIRYHYLDDIAPGSAYRWKYKWRHKGNTIAHMFLGSTELILTKDLYVYEPKSGKTYFLLENDSDWHNLGTEPTQCWFDESKKYLSLMYDNVNVVVDWEDRKMVARYVGHLKQGCLMDNEYWIFSEKGLRRVPFPLIEDVPPQKSEFG